MKALCTVVVLVLALAAPGMVLAATTIWVDDDAPNDPGPGDPAVSDPLEDGSAAHPFDAIQEGIDAAVNDDTVLVKDGTYTGTGNRDISFAGKAITVTSENGAATCIIDCQGLTAEPHRGFDFQSGETSASVLNGFAVINGAAQGPGGGILCVLASPRILNCLIANNSTTDEGGGVACAGPCNPTIERCRISGNSADSGGGISCTTMCDATITNCTIAGNESWQSGGGLYCFGSTTTTISSCTISGNRCSNSSTGHGILCDENASATMTNCLLWGNTAGSGTQIRLWSSTSPSTLIVRYSNVQGGAAEAYVAAGCTLDLDGTNIDADPLLAADGHLTAGSPCIDRCPTGPAHDIDAEARPVDVPGMGSGWNTYDIGSDEFADADSNSFPDWWELTYFGSATGAEQSVDEEPDGLTNFEEYTLGTDPVQADTDGDGRADGQELVDGTNPLHADNVEMTYYVNGDPLVGSDTYDGLAPSYDGFHGPKLTIQAGIDSAPVELDYTVSVAPGTYTGSGNKDLDFGHGLAVGTREIVLRAVTGAEVTIIDCEGSGRGFHFHRGETTASVVDGFAIIEGRYSFGGGILCDHASPLIRNCVIAGCFSHPVGGGLFLAASSPTIENCLVVDNSATAGGAGMGCLGSCSPTIFSSTFVGNSPDGVVGGLGTLTMSDCIVAGNVSRQLVAGTATIRNSCIQDGTGQPWFDPVTCIDADPLFVSGPLHDYYLSQTAAGQAVTSPCVDAGSDTAVNLGLAQLSTRTDSMWDDGIVDMGYHAPYVLEISSISRSGDDITIHWNALPSASYVVGWSEDHFVWNEVPVGAVEAWTDVGVLAGTPTGAHRYYRVREDVAAPAPGGAATRTTDDETLRRENGGPGATRPTSHATRPPQSIVGPNVRSGGNVARRDGASGGAGNVSGN
ncbi:MAG: right-handed parallel beta-helix repeat-containing protein [Verrucomicrobia bacterium]|nr:right-handed parallel beta-helix repeat-containing protein [Verrucomicrobiota bacterium]